MQKRTLFFDDQKSDPMNILFRLRLIQAISNINVQIAQTVKFFEMCVNKDVFDVFILDVMGSGEKDFLNIRNEIVPPVRIGLELLERLRLGYYSKQNIDALIIMRTARAGETNFVEKCLTKGANYCFSPGSDDGIIIDVINKHFRS